jgi:hypothetical protein
MFVSICLTIYLIEMILALKKALEWHHLCFARSTLVHPYTTVEARTDGVSYGIT